MINFNKIKVMYDSKSKTGYDSSGKPCSYYDEKGNYWWYTGNKDGCDQWEGSFKEL